MMRQDADLSAEEFHYPFPKAADAVSEREEVDRRDSRDDVAMPAAFAEHGEEIAQWEAAVAREDVSFSFPGLAVAEMNFADIRSNVGPYAFELPHEFRAGIGEMPDAQPAVQILERVLHVEADGRSVLVDEFDETAVRQARRAVCIERARLPPELAR